MRLILHNHFTKAPPVVSKVAGRSARDAVLRPHRTPRVKAVDCNGDESCGCGCHSHDAQPADYFVRVDAHLKTLASPEAKKKFLQDQFDAFEARYNAFQQRAASGGNIGPNETAWSYQETLSGIARRQGLI